MVATTLTDPLDIANTKLLHIRSLLVLIHADNSENFESMLPEFKDNLIWLLKDLAADASTAVCEAMA